MLRALRLLGAGLGWFVAVVGVVFGWAMVYSSVIQPLLIGPEVELGQAIFSIGMLLAACTFAYYCKSKTKAAKWATFFMTLLCVWAHAFAYVLLRLHRGDEVEGWELVRVGAGALVLLTFGALWTKALRVRHGEVSQ